MELCWYNRDCLIWDKDLPSLNQFASVDQLDVAMTDFTVIAASDTDVESYRSYSGNEWGPEDEGENFEERQNYI